MGRISGRFVRLPDDRIGDAFKLLAWDGSAWRETNWTVGTFLDATAVPDSEAPPPTDDAELRRTSSAGASNSVPISDHNRR